MRIDPIFCLHLFYLIILSINVYYDIKYQIIKIEYVYLVLPACICKWLLTIPFLNWTKLFEVVLVVLLLSMTSYVTKHLGKQDVMLMIATLILYGSYKSLYILLLSLVLVSVYGIVYIMIKNLRFRTSVPFVPFLWMSCIIVFLTP